MRDMDNREHDISGPLVNFDYTNELGGNITLDHPLFIGETVRLEASVKDVMHIRKGPLCYDYTELY